MLWTRFTIWLTVNLGMSPRNLFQILNTGKLWFTTLQGLISSTNSTDIFIYLWPIYSNLFNIEYIKITMTWASPPIATAAATAVDAAICFEFAQLLGRPKWKTMTVIACDHIIICDLILLYGQNTMISFSAADACKFQWTVYLIYHWSVTVRRPCQTSLAIWNTFI